MVSMMLQATKITMMTSQIMRTNMMIMRFPTMMMMIMKTRTMKMKIMRKKMTKMITVVHEEEAINSGTATADSLPAADIPAAARDPEADRRAPGEAMAQDLPAGPAAAPGMVHQAGVLRL